jgi:hypothetical protein
MVAVLVLVMWWSAVLREGRQRLSGLFGLAGRRQSELAREEEEEKERVENDLAWVVGGGWWWVWQFRVKIDNKE